MKYSNHPIYILYLGLVLLFANYFFNYVPLKEQIATITPFFWLFNLGFIFVGHNRIPFNKSNKRIIVMMMAFSCLSSVSCYINRGQGIYENVRALIPYLSIAYLYFILHKYPIKKEVLIKTLILLSITYVIVCLYQQFFAGEYLFGARSGEEIRMGLNRYCISGDRLCFIPLFYYLYQWAINKRFVNLLMCFVFILGIFLPLERMLLGGVLFGIVYFFIINKNMSFIQWIFAGLLLFGAYTFLTNDNLEGNFMEKNSANSDKGDDDIRVLSITYYTTEFQNGLGTILFGNGLENRKSTYGKLVENAEDIGLYRIDIGMFGEFNIFGLFYSLFMLSVLIKYCICKRNEISPVYTSIFAVMLFSYILNGVVDLPYRLALWPILMYLIDLDEFEKQYKSQI